MRGREGVDGPMSRVRRAWWRYLLVGLVSIEVSLQCFAFGYRWWVTRTHTSPTPMAEFRILCVGDSYTVGEGTDIHHSYPRQLEQLLMERWPERTFQVINAAMRGINSSQLLHRLPSQLREVRPHLVLVWIGGRDGVNFQEVDLATLQAVEAPWLTSLKIRLDQRLLVFQLYRMAKLLMLPRLYPESPFKTSATVSADASEVSRSMEERVLVELGELLKAEPNVARQILRDPTTWNPTLWPAEELYDRVVPWVQRAFERTPSDIRPLLRLGHLFHRHKRGDVARELFERALRLASTEQDALLARVTIAIDRYDFGRARSLLAQLIEQDQANSGYYVSLARAQMAQGAVDEAVASMRTALTINPDEGRAYHLLGRVFLGQEKWEQAKAMYQRAVELDLSNDRSWFWLTQVYDHLGQVELLRQAWREAFQRHHDLNALAGVGRSYQDAGQGREAMRALLEEVKTTTHQHPAYWESHERLVAHGMYEGLGEQLMALNIERIITLVTIKGVRLGLLTYPYPYPSDFDWTERVMRQAAARRPAIPMIDLQVLADSFGDPAMGLLSHDGYHPNAKGYGLVARRVMKGLEVAGILGASWDD